MPAKGSKPRISPARARRFRALVYRYYARAGRHDLPWRNTKSAYRIFVSEIMLQQTQVSRVIPKYRKFIREFPSFRALTGAGTARVLRAWQGLGYNRRALNMYHAAAVIVREHGGRLPKSEDVLRRLPGIGPGTAGSLRAFAFDLPTVFLETNIRRTIIHSFFPRRRVVSEAEVRAVAEAVLDPRHPRLWHSALMDYGAMLGRELPKGENANRRSAVYAKQSRFAGSDRELRGRMLRRALCGAATLEELERELGGDSSRVRRIAQELVREGFFTIIRGKFAVVDRA